MSNDRHIQKNIRFPPSLDDQIKANGLDGKFSALTIQMWETFLSSDELGIDHLENEVLRLSAELHTKETLLAEKKRLRDLAKKAGIQEKVERLVDAWVLRHLMTEESEGVLRFRKWGVLATKEDSNVAWFSLPYRSKFQIQMDVNNGDLKPDSELEKYAEYEFHAHNQKLKTDAREELIKRFSVEIGLKSETERLQE